MSNVNTPTESYSPTLVVDANAAAAELARQLKALRRYADALLSAPVSKEDLIFRLSAFSLRSRPP